MIEILTSYWILFALFAVLMLVPLTGLLVYSWRRTEDSNTVGWFNFWTMLGRLTFHTIRFTYDKKAGLALIWQIDEWFVIVLSLIAWRAYSLLVSVQNFFRLGPEEWAASTFFFLVRDTLVIVIVLTSMMALINFYRTRVGLKRGLYPIMSAATGWSLILLTIYLYQVLWTTDAELTGRTILFPIERDLLYLIMSLFPLRFFRRSRPAVLVIRLFLWGYRFFMVTPHVYIQGMTEDIEVSGEPQISKTPERGKDGALTTQVKQGAKDPFRIASSAEQFIGLVLTWRLAIYTQPTTVVDVWSGRFKTDGHEKTMRMIEQRVISIVVSKSDAFFQRRTMDQLLSWRKKVNPRLLAHLKSYLAEIGVELMQATIDKVMDIDDSGKGYVQNRERATEAAVKSQADQTVALAEAQAVAITAQRRRQAAVYSAEQERLTALKREDVRGLTAGYQTKALIEVAKANEAGAIAGLKEIAARINLFSPADPRLGVLLSITESLLGSVPETDRLATIQAFANAAGIKLEGGTFVSAAAPSDVTSLGIFGELLQKTLARMGGKEQLPAKVA